MSSPSLVELLEANLERLLAEALAAEHEAVFADKPVAVSALAAHPRSLAELSQMGVLEIRHICRENVEREDELVDTSRREERFEQAGGGERRECVITSFASWPDIRLAIISLRRGWRAANSLGVCGFGLVESEERAGLNF